MSQQEIIGIQRELNVTHITGGKLAKLSIKMVILRICQFVVQMVEF